MANDEIQQVIFEMKLAAHAAKKDVNLRMLLESWAERLKRASDKDASYGK